MARAGRKRKIEVVRDKNGISRQSRLENKKYYEMTLERRGRELERDGLSAEHAPNRLAGFTLGRLRLLHDPKGKFSDGISLPQYNTGCELAEIIHDHANINGTKLHVKSPSALFIGGRSTREDPDKEYVKEVSDKFVACYNAMAKVCRIEGSPRAFYLTYGICVDNWPIEAMKPGEVGLLRLALNEIGNALRQYRKGAQL